MSHPSGRFVALSPIPARAGIGLRFPHHQQVVASRPEVGFLEIHAENYFGGGTARRYLERLRPHYPISVHGVGLSLGSAGELDPLHLARLAELVSTIEPALVSEHLAWSVSNGHYLADLLPLPMTEEALAVVCRHVEQTQERLECRILIENPSTYLQFPHSTIPEWEFLAAVAERTGCGILCDLNNIFVSASNHGWEAALYLEALPPASIAELHLAGHALRVQPDGGTLRIDNHGSPVSAPVWALFQRALELFGPRPTLIEWDTDIPPLPVLLHEADMANELLACVAGSTAHASAA